MAGITMRTSNAQATKFSATVVKILMALVLALMVGGTFSAPAFGGDHDRPEGYHQHGRYYSEPVYELPPVGHATDQYQSPGIGIVFGIHLR